MRRAKICCSQSDTSFNQSVFAEHVTKIRDKEDTIEEDVREMNVRPSQPRLDPHQPL